MGKYLNVGNAGFSSIRKGIYVDKTELISFINNTLGTKDKLTCVSRPRRFGKSYATQMLCAYYDKSCNSKELFADCKIARDTDFSKYLNKYNVIYLDITLFISRTDNIKNVVKNINDLVTSEICQAYPNIKRDSSLVDTLFNITDATGEKFIMIIDEWDALFREATDDLTLQKEYIDLLRSLFKSSLTDVIFEAAYMTGILPIKKYGSQSAVSDFREYTMLSPGHLAKYIGFTEPEVIELCQKYNMDFSEMKDWYDGYSFRHLKSVYSPNSVIEAIKRDEFGSYWARTETYNALKIYIDLNEDGLKEAIVQMLGGAHIVIDAGTFQNDMTSIKRKDDVLTLLVHLGYLAYDAPNKTVFIPNEEVRQEFVRAVIAGRHTKLAKLIQNSDHLLEQTLSLNAKAVAAAIEEAHNAGTAPLFYNNEQALRSVIRFAYISCIDEFQEIQELPSGKGYADVVFIPKSGSPMPALVIELKWNKTADGAIQQIKTCNYPQVLQGITDEILLVGVNYNENTKKHTCRIEKYQTSL